jgi:hypothetical protein
MDQMVNIERLLIIIGRLTVEKDMLAEKLAQMSARVQELESNGNVQTCN